MERDVLDAVDQLRNQLGLFYWIIQHGGDVKVAAQLLQDVVRRTEKETAPWCVTVPQTLFARWSQLQLTTLLREARQTLKRMNCDLPIPESPRPVHPQPTNWQGEENIVSLYGPLV
jgi:hypothetical protein